ncbi:MAG: VTT domain-containing protein [Planctomycetaceae bacterium]|nr:VTT domain-containing protein [Planctomycetaceae bacterium]
MSHSRRLLPPLLLISLVLLVPVMPFLILGDGFESRVQAWVQQEWSFATRFWLIVAVLSVDILLPIPSSGVSTYAGGTLGFAAGTLASWLGMSLGAIVGFALARGLGRPFAIRFGGVDVETMEQSSLHYGPAALVVTRALPILAEACVLLMGVVRMSWRRFLPPVLMSNAAISVTYAAFGAYFSEQGSLSLAVIASVLLPMAITLVIRERLRRDADEQSQV